MKRVNRIFLGTVIALWGLTANGQDIYTAVKAGDLNAVNAMLTTNPGLVDTVNDNMATPLHFAAAYGKLDIAKLLLENGAKLEAQNAQQKTPLYNAISRNQIETAKYLIEKGADVNAVSMYGTTAIHDAAYFGYIDMVKLLIANRADLNVDSPVLTTPLHRAVFGGNMEMVKLLIDNGADIKGHNGTVLIEASIRGLYNIAQYLISKDADLNAIGRTGQTPLQTAIEASSERTDDLVKLYVDAGADVNILDVDKESALMNAVRKGFVKSADYLIKHGADTKIKDPLYNRTLLHIAAIKGYSNIVDVLIPAGIDLEAMDVQKHTAYWYSAKYGNEKTAQKLTEAGAKSKAKEKNFGFSPLLTKKMKDGQGYVWYMDNRGWIVKTKNHLLVFDNEERGRKPDEPKLSNGFITADEIAEQNVFAIYTAFHGEPGTMEFIHCLEDSVKNITYIHYEGDRWRGNRNVRYLKGGDSLNLEGLKLTTLETRDMYGMGSLGYLVETDGLKIFYSNLPPEDVEPLKAEIDLFAEKSGGVDFAFLYFVPGEENPAAEYVMSKLKPKTVFPRDFSDMNHSGMEFGELLRKSYPGVKFEVPENGGDNFLYKSRIG